MIELTLITVLVLAVVFVAFMTKPASKDDGNVEDNDKKTKRD